jgi:hypothetical protein
MNALSDQTNIEQACDSAKCKLNCNLKIDESRRKEINIFYTNLQIDARKQYIFFNVSKVETNGLINKYEYKLDGKMVCSYFFLKTLNIKCQKSIGSLFERKDDVIKNKNHWKSHTHEFNKSIEIFIMSYKPEKSHYNIKNCPNRLYINDIYRMNATKLYIKFSKSIGFKPRFNTNRDNIDKKNENSNICGFAYFNKYRKNMKIGFSQLSEDKCIICKEQLLRVLENKNCN